VKEKQPDITEQLSKEMEILKAEVQFLKNDNAVLRQQIEYWKQS
jgi:chaperonin cofactor prefoldin